MRPEQLLRSAQQLGLFDTTFARGPTRVGNLLVEPIDGVPGRPWCVHSSAPHSSWIEFYRSRDEAEVDALAMLERGRG